MNTEKFIMIIIKKLVMLFDAVIFSELKHIFVNITIFPL